MKNYTKNYLAVWVVTLVLFCLCITAVTSGNGTIRFMGARMNLAEGSRYGLYKLSDTLAFELRKDQVSLVSYEKTTGLYSLAGDYQHAPVEAKGSVFMPVADYQKGDYIYTSYPIGPTSVVNIKSGEKLGQLVKAEQTSVNIPELSQYKEKGLVFEEQYKLTPEKIKAQYPMLNTYNDNLFTVELAFALIFTLLFLGGIPVVLRRSKRENAF